MAKLLDFEKKFNFLGRTTKIRNVSKLSFVKWSTVYIILFPFWTIKIKGSFIKVRLTLNLMVLKILCILQKSNDSILNIYFYF